MGPAGPQTEATADHPRRIREDNMHTITKKILAPLLASAVLGSAVSAEELSFAHFVPPAHIITSSIVEPLSTAVAAASA